MTTINDLTQNASVASSDQFPIWDNSNGGTRKVSALAFQSFVTSQLAPSFAAKVNVADLADATSSTLGAGMVGYDATTARDVLDNARALFDYTALRAYSGRALGVRLTKTGIAGQFWRDDSDTTTADNGGTVIVDSITRRWKRLYSSDIIADWFEIPTDPTADCSARLQAAIDAAIAARSGLILLPRSYRINSALRILGRLSIDFSDRLATLLLGTPNMNGIEIGDGTDAIRNATFGVQLIAPAFSPYPGVSPSTDGACIHFNYVAYVDVIRPSVYGKDGATRKLFHAIRMERATECDVSHLVAQELLGQGITCAGTAGPENRVVDCNFDFARVIGCSGTGIFLGAYTHGIGLYRPIMYNIEGKLIHINAPGTGQNYFITDVDGEIQNTGGAAYGIHVEAGNKAIIKGGWLGANAPGGTPPIAVHFGAGADSCTADVDTFSARIVIDGAACTIAGGDIVGDAATAGSGITIGGAQTVIASGVRVRQWVTSGIAWSGTPGQVQIGNVSFRSNGTDIAPLPAFTALTAPLIEQGTTEKSASLAAAATMAVPNPLRVVQVSGATAITTIPPHGTGARLTIQADGGGINLNTGGNLALVAAPVAVPAFGTISLVCDGVNWFDDGRSF